MEGTAGGETKENLNIALCLVYEALIASSQTNPRKGSRIVRCVVLLAGRD